MVSIGLVDATQIINDVSTNDMDVTQPIDPISTKPIDDSKYYIRPFSPTQY
jgi:hypothetical protein